MAVFAAKAIDRFDPQQRENKQYQQNVRGWIALSFDNATFA